MIRNKYGSNLDLGVPLDDEFELEKLFIPINNDCFDILKDWVLSKNEPIYIGGQIGIGKSTFINKYFRDNSFIPDIILHFDTNGNNLSSGDFLQILLTEIINYAILNNYDISSFITPEAFTNGKINRWEEYVKIFNTDHIDLSIFNFKESVIANLIKNRKYISEVLCKIVLYYEKILERPLIFFASGIDKFENNSAALLMLQDSIEFLANFKTIFEVNAIHFFSDFIPESSLRIFLLPFRADRIIELLDKRMGVYSNRISDVITEIGENSGGNPRQAIRLLTNYLNFKSLGVESKNAVKLSKETTQNDFFLFAKRPSDVLLKYVKKNKSLSTTTFKLPGDNETALRALYSNWIFINNNSIEESKWSVEVNPLVTQLIDTKGVKEYDQIILDNYLVNNQISPSGSNIPIKDENANNNNYYYASFRNEIEKEKDYSFYISKTLDLISYSLLSKDREERIIIAYKDKSIIKPIRYYLFAKANTFEYQSFSHYDLEKNNLPLSMQILDIMNKGNADIYSFDFNAINKEQMVEIDAKRDTFLKKQMIWWIPFEKLIDFLNNLTQLRQLFQVFVLDNNIMKNIKKNEIEADLNYYKELKAELKTKESLLLINLSKILEWIEANERQYGE